MVIKEFFQILDFASIDDKYILFSNIVSEIFIQSYDQILC